MRSRLHHAQPVRFDHVPRVPLAAFRQARSVAHVRAMGATSGVAHDFSNVRLFSTVGTSGSVAAGDLDAETNPDAGPATASEERSDAGPAADAGPEAETRRGPEDAPSREAPPSERRDQDEPEAPEPDLTCAIESKTAVHAPDMTPDTRTTIGACETVLFSIGGQVADWTSSSGWPQSRTGRSRYEWAAPEEAGTSTITAAVPATGHRCSIDMNVIAPESVGYRNVNELTYPAGEAGAGMQLTVHLRPRNVNFGWLAIREDDVAAAGINGYFTRFTAAQLRHAATPDFARIGWNNSLAPNAAGDPQGDTAATVQGTLAQTWAAGRYHWSIPVRYRCSNSTGNGRIFARTLQRFVMEDDGTVIVTKGTARVERTP